MKILEKKSFRELREIAEDLKIKFCADCITKSELIDVIKNKMRVDSF